ncbi:MAG: 2-phosphosulfolactate phosphatase [Myxococcales bacterium]
MQVRIVTGTRGAAAATGDVVIIDVIRAFTTAAYAFAAGIDEIELVATVEEALSRPGFRMGEVGGRPVPGFDHGNSPSQLVGRALSGRAVQRTSSGTQGVVLAKSAATLWLGSLVVASATARALARSSDVSLVAMGGRGEPAEEEDMAAAIYISALLHGKPPPRENVLAMVRGSRAAALHAADSPDRPRADIDCCCAVDAFDFAMKVDRADGLLLAHVTR